MSQIRYISTRTYLTLEDTWRREQLCGGKKSRFGQWFLDRYQPGVRDSELYYTTHVRYALVHILNTYVRDSAAAPAAPKQHHEGRIHRLAQQPRAKGR